MKYPEDFINKIICTDCREGMRDIPDGSIDLIVTDPPYHLSDIKPLKDRLEEIIRSFNNIILPNFNKGDIKLLKYSELVNILVSSPNLRRFQRGSGEIESWIGVPKCAIDFNCDIKIRQVEIDAGYKSASLFVSNGKLMDKRDIEKFEFIGDFIFDFGDAIDFPSSNIHSCNMGQFFDGFFAMSIGAIDLSGSPRFKTSQSFVFSSNDFMKNIRLGNNTRSDSKSSSFVLTSWRTKNGFMLRYDRTGRTAELLPANGTDQRNLSRSNFSPKLVRTFAGTSCLSAIFKPIPVGFIINTAIGTNSFYFHLWLPPQLNIARIYKEVKGFMGKKWDVLASPKIWQECLRVLKPGAIAFIMCAPRQDVLSRQIINLEEVGFITGFSSIYWAYASGFPKAQNISKAIDKKECMEQLIRGLEREPTNKEFKEAWNQFGTTGVIKKGAGKNPKGLKFDNGKQSGGHLKSKYLERNAISPQAKLLNGSYGGFQPKPAVEVILVVMKPLSEKTYMEQALKNRKGITWFDDGRIPYKGKNDFIISHHNKQLKEKDKSTGMFGATNGFGLLESNISRGRFPANILVSDDVLNDGNKHSSKHTRLRERFKQYRQRSNIYMDTNKMLNWKNIYYDSGSFSRYFDLDKWWVEKIKQLPESVQKTFPFLIVPKASKAEKNRGCEKLEEKARANINKMMGEAGNFKTGSGNERTIKFKNHHPTVKPIKLMSYLIILGSRPNDIILDPFMGSGTTCIAAKMLGRNYIGFDNDKEYVEIAQCRLRVIEAVLI